MIVQQPRPTGSCTIKGLAKSWTACAMPVGKCVDAGPCTRGQGGYSPMTGASIAQLARRAPYAA